MEDEEDGTVVGKEHRRFGYREVRDSVDEYIMEKVMPCMQRRKELFCFCSIVFSWVW